MSRNDTLGCFVLFAAGGTLAGVFAADAGAGLVLVSGLILVLLLRKLA